MQIEKNPKLGGYLFIAAGVIFVAIAAVWKQGVYHGIGPAFIAIGAAMMAKKKSEGNSGSSA